MVKYSLFWITLQKKVVNYIDGSVEYYIKRDKTEIEQTSMIFVNINTEKKQLTHYKEHKYNSYNVMESQ